MKKLKIIIIFTGLCICICGCEHQQMKENQQQNLSEEDIKGEMQMADMEESVNLLMTALSCEQKNAESVIRSLRRQNIEIVSDAVLLDSADGYQVQIEDGEKYIYTAY